MLAVISPNDARLSDAVEDRAQVRAARRMVPTESINCSVFT